MSMLSAFFPTYVIVASFFDLNAVTDENSESESDTEEKLKGEKGFRGLSTLALLIECHQIIIV